VNHDAIAVNQNVIVGLEASVAKLLIKGAQCGYRNYWPSSGSTITYDHLLLDTGVGSLSTSTGEYTAEVGGLYQVTWSLTNRVDSGEYNWIYLYKNDEAVEGGHHSYYQNSDGYIYEQGGRTLLLELDEGDRLHLGTTTFYGSAYYITFCVHLTAAS